MSLNDSVVVSIKGDASGVAPAIQETKAQIGGIEPLLNQLNSQLGLMSNQMKESFQSGVVGAEKFKSGLQTAHAATEQESNALTRMVMKIHEGAESMRTFQMRAKEFAELYVALFAVDRIRQFIQSMAEAADKVEHLSQQLGVSTDDIQRLQGIALATGIPIDALTTGMALLDRNMANAAAGSRRMEQAMRALGISLNDGRSQMEKLETVADKFKNMDDGPKKAALAMQLFGRQGRELIPVLNLGSAGIEQLNSKMDQYGIVNEGAIEKGARLAAVVNEGKLAFAGFQGTLMDALAPAFTAVVEGTNELIAAFIKSYDEGGAVAQVMDVLSGTIAFLINYFKSLGQILAAVGQTFADMSRIISGDAEQTFGQNVPNSINYTKQAMKTLNGFVTIFKDGILIALEFIKSGFEQVADRSVAAGKVMYDALTFNWGDIQADWDNGLAAIEKSVQKTATKIEGLAKEMHNAFLGKMTLADIPLLPPELQGIQTPKAGGNFDFSPSPAGKKEKKPKDDLVQQLEEELEAKKVAWALAQDAQGTAEAYSLQDEAAFWDAKRNLANLSTKDRLAIDKKWLAARQALQKQAETDLIDGFKEELAEAGTNSAKKLEIVRREYAEISHLHGKDSAEAKTAAMAVLAAEREAHAQSMQMWDQYYKHLEKMRLMDVDAAKAEADYNVAMGKETKGELIQQEMQFESQRYAIKRDAMEKELALINQEKDPEKWRAKNEELLTLDKEYEAKRTELSRQASLERTQIERTAISSISSGWATAISQMITLQKGMAATFKSLWTTLQSTIASAITSILQNWLTKQISVLLLGRAAHAASAVAYISAEAAKAGAGGVASMAAAPFPLDLGAPAFGASMGAAAMAFMPAASAEGGWWDVQPGMAMLHANEMVLPAWAAAPLRSMIGNAANANTPMQPSGEKSGGDTHLHLHGNIIQNPNDLRQWFERNHVAVGAGVRSYVRNGGNISASR